MIMTMLTSAPLDRRFFSRTSHSCLTALYGLIDRRAEKMMMMIIMMMLVMMMMMMISRGNSRSFWNVVSHVDHNGGEGV